MDPIKVDDRFAEAVQVTNPGISSATGYAIARTEEGLMLTAWNAEGEPPTEEAVAAALLEIDWDQKRRQKNTILLDTDYIWQRHSEQVQRGIETTLTTEQLNELLAWREAVRNAIKAAASPDQVVFPPRPGT